MKKTLFAAALVVAASAGSAFAGGSPGSIGVGAEYMLTPFAGGGVGGPSLNYDAGAFHVGGFVMLADPAGDDNTTFGVGGRFYYHVHATAMSDFSVGGQIGIVNQAVPGPPDSQTGVFIEPGAQIRAFITPNVAISANIGITIGAADADGLAITGDVTGGAGIHYYFF